jgi:TRAP transporter TAXI family solute receptor
VSDLAHSPGVKVKLIDHADLVGKMNQKYGNLYVEDRIPKETYRGMDADNRQATVMNLLVAHQNMDDKTAYNIVKTVFEKLDELIRVHKEAENFKLENQKSAAAGGIPWHPGALKYFAEKGVKVN